MDENAKEYLYEQLEQIAQYSVKEDKEELISKEKFMEMTGVECLRYVFEYRDNNEPYEFNGEKGEAYIQVPNIDLSNEDLNDVILRGFILSHPENDDEVISSINFANTGITLDLNSILENQTEQTGAITKRIIDFSQCNFEGCTIYGILPDEYQSETSKITDGYEVRGRKKLGEEYIERRNQLHDVQAPKTLSRRAYERLTDGRDFSRLNGITDATEIHLEDLDFDTNDEQGLGKMYQTLYGELETRENLNGIYTNMNLSSELIKSTFQKLNGGYAKGKFLQELVKEGKELDFVKEEFKRLSSVDKSKVLQELVRQGKELDFVKEKCESLYGESKSQVLQELVRQGKEFEFVFKNVRYIQDEETKKKVKEQAKQRGISEKKIEWQFKPNGDNLLKIIDEDIDFVKEKCESLYGESKSKVLQELIRQGKELDFVKEKYEDLDYINRSQFLQELIRQGKELDFVKEKYEDLNYHINRSKVLQELIRQGKELDFVKEKFKSLSSEDKSEVLQELVRQGKELDFVKEKFKELLYPEDESPVLQELVRQGKEFEFVFKNARYIQDEETKKKVKEQAKQRGISEKKIEWQFNPNGDNLLKIIDEDIDFVKEKFEGLVNKDKNQVLQELIRRGEYQELVNEYWRYREGNETIEINSNQFRNIVGCGEKETQELIKLIERSQISLTDLIRKKAILASCGIDIKDVLKNRTLMQTSPAVLYAKKRYCESVGKPTNISNLGMPRSKFESMSGKTLTNICNEYVFLDRNNNLRNTVVEEINKEIQEQKEKKAKQSENMPNQQQSKTEAKSNSKAHKANPVVSTFLQTQVGITEKQEQKLGEWLQRFNYDIYIQNVEEDLALKKQIFDQFGVTSQAFGMSCKILTIPLKTLYARAQFLKDIGEKVIPANLMATLGANGDIFAKKYGSYFMEEKSEQDVQYIVNVENATNENYPIPSTKEEIMRKIKEMEEEQK